jgi:hypothetical protein
MNVKVDAFEKDEMKFANLGLHIWVEAHYNGQRLLLQYSFKKLHVFELLPS